jgi:peptidoglycan/LPS O-acetylase OafA/YrhL
MEKSRQPLLDILRGLAAFWVFLFHVKEGGHIDKLLTTLDSGIVRSVFSAGNSAVAMFFVLSGFVIAQSANEISTKTGALHFLVRRGWRICPAYYLSIGVALAYIAMKAAFTGSVTAWPNFLDVAAHLLFLQDLVGVRALNTVYWTLCIEIQFYIGFVILVIIAKRLARHLPIESANVFTFGSAAVIGLLGPCGFLQGQVINASLLPTLHLFLLGILLNFTLKKTTWAMVQYVTYAVVLALVSVSTQNAFTLIGVATSVILLVSSRWTPAEPARLLRAMSFFGLISYSFYLFHNNVTGASFNLIRRYLGTSLAGEIVGLVFSMSLCTAIAAACYYAIERPGMRVGQRWISRRTRGAAVYPVSGVSNGSKALPD